jgi:hypothetical protein
MKSGHGGGLFHRFLRSGGFTRSRSASELSHAQRFNREGIVERQDQASLPHDGLLRSFPMPRAAYILWRNLQYASLHGRIIGTLPAVKTASPLVPLRPFRSLVPGMFRLFHWRRDTHDPVEETS